jgi:general nucleoside transport system permease protein
MNYIRKILQQLLGPSLALIFSFIIGGIFISIIGRDPVEIYTRFFSQSLGTWYGIGQILFKATPLIFTGLSAAIGFRAGLFNIGAEGQLTIGALFTAIAGSFLMNIPSIFAIPICLLSGVIGGAIWGIIPGVFKARFGSHEVINTIMMNFIAAGLASYLVINVFGVPATVHTQEISSTAGLARLEILSNVFRGSPVNMSFFIAILCCIFVYVILWKTRLGYELRALGLSPTAAEYGGINKPARIIIAMTLAGGFAGLVGSNFVLGYKHYFELGFSEGIGFIGIAVALLAKNNPIGIIFTALFFGTLEYGSLTINTLVPKELSNILQAIVILLMIGLTKYVDRWFIRFQSKASEIVNG